VLKLKALHICISFHRSQEYYALRTVERTVSIYEAKSIYLSLNDVPTFRKCTKTDNLQIAIP